MNYNLYCDYLIINFGNFRCYLKVNLHNLPMLKKIKLFNNIYDNDIL